MSADGFITQDLFFAVGMLYTFGEDALLKIEPAEDSNPRRKAQNFVLDAPSLDCQEYFSEFKARTFAISDLLAYANIHTRVIQILKDMHRRGDTEWTSPSYSARW